ncbi:hypothetical protein ACLOJK_024612 [Asimina triloba]
MRRSLKSASICLWLVVTLSLHSHILLPHLLLRKALTLVPLAASRDSEKKKKKQLTTTGGKSIRAMASTVNAVGEPIPTSAVLMSSSKHIATKCRSENLAFLSCKKRDPNPEKCLDKGQQVTRCVLGFKDIERTIMPALGALEGCNLLKDLHQRCTKEMDAYAGCMYYHTNEFDLCRKEQQAFESALAVLAEIGLNVSLVISA